MIEPPVMPRESLPPNTLDMARFLIGARLVRKIEGGLLVGRIVETEAYVEGDAASHAFRGRTKRNWPMFLPRGHVYVYLAYGISRMLNVSGGGEGQGEAVLIRAIEPLAGADAMQNLRGGVPPRQIGSGPGKLGAALDVSFELNGLDLCVPGPLWLSPHEAATREVGSSIRIGITKAADLPYRFYERGNPHVSGPRGLSP